MPYCGKCGVKITDNDIFCGKCGEPVDPRVEKGRSDYVHRDETPSQDSTVVHRKGSSLAFFLAVFFLTIFCLFLFANNQTLFVNNQTMVSEIRKYDSQISDLENIIERHISTIDKKDKDNWELRKKLSARDENIEAAEWREKHIIFIPDDGSRLYHRFSCPDFQKYWNRGGYYWFFDNAENARYHGYRSHGCW